jgi:hypothetical protein
MRQAEAAFVDSAAWIALALSRDPLHAQAREHWELLRVIGFRLVARKPKAGLFIVLTRACMT